ncbi:MAG: site-specific tyrosine recombinase [Candidatus Zixiibacteriota bacterium]
MNDFLEYLRLERGLSANSIAAYSGDLREFYSSVGLTRPSDIRPGRIVDYLGRLTDQSRKPSTIARKISSLKQYLAYLSDEGVVKGNPASILSSPKIARYHPHYLSPLDIMQILDGIDVATLIGLRDRAIIELLYGSGLRISELVGLKQDCVEWEAGFVRITGKGSKQRIVPLGGPARTAMTKYLESRLKPASSAYANYVFLSRLGKGLSRVAAWKMVRKRVLAVGIAKSVSPHTFRHSFATHLLDGGADLRLVQEMLGHADISTTEIYMTVDRDYLIAEHKKYHPRELAGAEDN